MGADKALLRWQGSTMLDRTLAIAHQTCDQVFICGSASLYGEFGEVIEDTEAGRGPLSGIQSALRATRTDLNLILSVDLPLMAAGFLNWLLEQARSSGEKIVVPQAHGRVQPLCAVYHREVGTSVEQAMAEGDLKVTRLFTRAKTRIIAEDEIRAAGFSPDIFTNVNTPEEYKSLPTTHSAEQAAEVSHE